MNAYLNHHNEDDAKMNSIMNAGNSKQTIFDKLNNKILRHFHHSFIFTTRLMSQRKIIFVALFLWASLMVKGQSKDSLQIMKATETFLKAFTSFDWNTFRNSFSFDATIFFPIWEHRKRRTGQKEIDSTWLQIFPEFVDPTKKFDLKIDPKNILIQVYNNTGIVTFHVGGDDYLSRRTVVFVKENASWKIVHLHASGLKKPD